MTLKKIILFLTYSLSLYFIGYFIGHVKEETTAPLSTSLPCSKTEKIDSTTSSSSININLMEKVPSKQSERIELKNKPSNLMDIQQLFERANELQIDPDRNRDDIVRVYDDILELDPQNELALSSLGNYLVYLQEFELAKNVLQKCLRFHPQNDLCNGDFSNIYLAQNKFDDAKAALDRCLENTPHNSLCHNNLASYYIQTNQADKAIEIFKNLLEGKLKSSVVMERSYLLHQLSVAYTSKGDRENSQKYLKEACDEGNEIACGDLQRFIQK